MHNLEVLLKYWGEQGLDTLQIQKQIALWQTTLTDSGLASRITQFEQARLRYGIYLAIFVVMLIGIVGFISFVLGFFIGLIVFMAVSDILLKSIFFKVVPICWYTEKSIKKYSVFIKIVYPLPIFDKITSNECASILVLCEKYPELDQIRVDIIEQRELLKMDLLMMNWCAILIDYSQEKAKEIEQCKKAHNSKSISNLAS